MMDHRRRATDQTREGDTAGGLAAEVARLRAELATASAAREALKAQVARRDQTIARYDDELSAWRGVTALPLYCWSCRTVHEIALPDVERIVYALGAAELLAYQSGFDDGSIPGRGPTRLPEDSTTCHRTTLRHAGDIEVFAEHVEQGVECRQAIGQDNHPTTEETP